VQKDELITKQMAQLEKKDANISNLKEQIINQENVIQDLERLQKYQQR
jgi:hypothetical protein